MNQSEQVGELFTALAEAQGELINPEKSREATVKMKAGGSYKFSYADMADVSAGVRPILAKHGLSFTQPTSLDGSAMMLETIIAHKSGQWISSLYPVCTMGGDHQAMGAAMTYARRYALCTMLGIAADDDNAGDGAVGMDTDTLPKPQRTSSNTNALPASKRKTAAQAKRDGDWDRLTAMFDEAEDIDALRTVWAAVQAELNSLPASWKEHFTDRKDQCKADLQSAQSAPVDPEIWLQEYAEELAGCVTPTEITELNEDKHATLQAYPEDIQKRAATMSLDAAQKFMKDAAE